MPAAPDLRSDETRYNDERVHRARAEGRAEMTDAVVELDAKTAKLRAALERIVALPPGSRGGYGKFTEAQRIAKAALA